MKPLSIYIHWPYCVSKCPYCAFASVPARGGGEEEAWRAACAKELAHYAGLVPDREIVSVYFGGGTPSLLCARSVEGVITSVAERWPLAANCEITLEANPESSSFEKFRDFRVAGVNRLSLGIQSFDEKALRFLGRAHSATQARRALEAAARIFDRYSFDLIYGRAGQTPEAWKNELEEALLYAPRHISLYQLTIEENTPFYERSNNETLTVLNETAADLFDLTQKMTEKAGLSAYEISNHAVQGEESRHNMAYWRYDDYLGIGPAAHGRFIAADEKRLAIENERATDKWIKAVTRVGNGRRTLETLSSRTAKEEALIMGLRLRKGIDKENWLEKFGTPLDEFVSGEKVKSFVRQGLIRETKNEFCASDEGRKKLDALLALMLT